MSDTSDRRYSGYIFAGDPQVPVYITTIVSVLSPNELLSIRHNIVLHTILSDLFRYTLMNIWKQRPEASVYQMDDICFGSILGEGTYHPRAEFNPISHEVGSAVTGLALFASIFIIRDLRKTPLQVLNGRIRRARPSAEKTRQSSSRSKRAGM